MAKTDDYITSAGKQIKVRDLERRVDELVYKLYGLTPEEITIVKARF